MMNALEFKDQYQVGELFADEIGQVMNVDEEQKSDSEEVCILDHMNSSRNRGDGYQNKNSNKDLNTCYKCGRTGYFAKECPYTNGNVDGTPPLPNIIGTVTHTMEAQTPVTDKSLTDFLYKNFKSTEKYKQKAGKLQTKLTKAKQELKNAKKEMREVIAATTKELTNPKKMVTFAKTPSNKAVPPKGTPSPKGKIRGNSKLKTKPKFTTANVNTTPKVSEVAKAIVKTEPVSAIHSESEESEDDQESQAPVEEVTDASEESSDSSGEEDTE